MIVANQTKRGLKSSAITASAIFVVDAFVLNQGALAGITILYVIFYLIPKAVYCFFKGLDWRFELRQSGLFLLASLMVFAANHYNNQLAYYRANELIVKIQLYKKDTGQYPKKLDAMIPKYISAVPVPKFTLAFNDFLYRENNNQPFLLYATMPPFGRRMYFFERQAWSDVD